ncbi:hypothetical protein D3C73_1192520 [compost metagenome]
MARGQCPGLRLVGFDQQGSADGELGAGDPLQQDVTAAQARLCRLAIQAAGDALLAAVVRREVGLAVHLYGAVLLALDNHRLLGRGLSGNRGQQACQGKAE